MPRILAATHAQRCAHCDVFVPAGKMQQHVQGKRHLSMLWYGRDGHRVRDIELYNDDGTLERRFRPFDVPERTVEAVRRARAAVTAPILVAHSGMVLFDRVCKCFDPELLCAAHRHGTRVVIGSAAQNSPIWSGQAALANATHRAALVESIVANVQRYQADGANVDIEQPDPSLRSAMTAFVCELGAALGRAVPGAQLTMDMPVRPISYHSLVEYDYTSLAECVDYFVLMVRTDKPSPI